MYEDFMKLAQDALKPAMKLAENNTALAVKLVQAQADNAAELMQANLDHVKALVETKDLNVAVEMQQKYVESLNDKLVTSAKENAAAIEAAVTEAGKMPVLRLDIRPEDAVQWSLYYPSILHRPGVSVSPGFKSRSGLMPNSAVAVAWGSQSTINTR